MANIKISQLPAASAGAAAQELEINDSGTSRKLTVDQLTAYVGANHTHTISNITDFTDNSTNWDTAYSWGNHAAENYVVSSDTPTDGQILVYDTVSGWIAENPVAGATGGGTDQIFWENGQVVTTDYTITDGKNAMSAGPITINTGVTVTVGAGETWTVV